MSIWLPSDFWVSGHQSQSDRVNPQLSLESKPFLIWASILCPGSIGYGVGATTAISSNVPWIGSSSGVPRIVRFGEGGGFSVTTSVGPYRQGFVSALSGQNATSHWATVQDGVCPSGKASCMQVGSLSATNDSGQNWSLVNLTPMSASPS
jgi:hypothetical protein